MSQVMFWEKEITSDAIQKATEKFFRRTGNLPVAILVGQVVQTDLPQKRIKIPAGHFILSDENK